MNNNSVPDHAFVKTRLVAPALALALVVCASLARADAGNSTILTGKVIATVMRGVPIPFNAIVDAVLVKPGDPVEEGSPLMRYHLQDEAERILQLEITTGAGIEEYKSSILDTQRKLAELTAQRNKTRQLVASGLGSRQALARLDQDVEATQSRIEILRTLINKKEASFKARLKELEGYFGQPIKEGCLLPETLTLTSPIKGYVLSVQTPFSPGQLLGAGSTPIIVGQLNPVLIQVPVYEAEVNSIRIGNTAEVEIPSLGNRKFKGMVSEISWISTDMSVAGPSYYNVELTVANPDLLLKPGFKAIVRFGGGD